MAAPTTSAEYVVLRRPDLSGDTRIADLILLAEGELSAELYGADYFKAVGLLALHYVEMSKSATGMRGGNRTGSAGAVTSVSEGSVSRSYDVSSLTSYASDLNSTTWGIELNALTRRKIVFVGRTRMM